MSGKRYICTTYIYIYIHTYRVVSKQVNHAILAEKEVGVLNRIIYIYIYI